MSYKKRGGLSDSRVWLVTGEDQDAAAPIACRSFPSLSDHSKKFSPLHSHWRRIVLSAVTPFVDRTAYAIF
jgi:hypothetical protein